jgi:hypothetical protein
MCHNARLVSFEGTRWEVLGTEFRASPWVLPLSYTLSPDHVNFVVFFF